MYENVVRRHEEKKAQKFCCFCPLVEQGFIGGLEQRLSRWDNAVCGGPPPSSTHLSFSAAFCNPLGIIEQETMRPFLCL